MLKLKEGIDFTELDNFGFKKIGEFWYIKELLDESGCKISVGISTIDREIQISVGVDGSATFFTRELDCIYNLILAGYVEKV